MSYTRTGAQYHGSDVKRARPDRGAKTEATIVKLVFSGSQSGLENVTSVQQRPTVDRTASDL